MDTVLDYLSFFWPLGEIILKELTLKLVTLSDCHYYWLEISDPDSFGHIRAVHAEEWKFFHFCPQRNTLSKIELAKSLVMFAFPGIL